MSKKIYVTTPNAVPAGEHWAIIEGSSVFIPGDERSRTNPGHGYPESTEHFITYCAYDNEQEFRTDLEKKLLDQTRSSYSSRPVVGIHVEGVFQARTEIKLTETKR